MHVFLRGSHSAFHNQSRFSTADADANTAKKATKRDKKWQKAANAILGK